MIVSHKHKFIFIKTFKTAGSSIEKILHPQLGSDDILRGSDYDDTPSINAPSKGRHKGAEELLQTYPREFNDYFTFAVDRNPWDVVVSHFYWHKKATKTIDEEIDFSTWCIENKKEWWRINNWRKYTIDNKIAVDAVLQYEKLDEQLRNIPIPYNGELSTVKLKSGFRPNSDYRSLYDNVTKDIVKQNFGEVIEHFGYEF